MAKKIINQTAFTSGEVSTVLDGRADTAEYQHSLQTATNATVTAYGPIRRRNGSKYIAEIKSSSAVVRLLRFQFSQDIAYILELGNTYIRFYTNEAQVLSGGSPYEIVSPYTTAQLPDIQVKQKGNQIFTSHPSVTPRTLTLNSDLTWSIKVTDFSPPPSYESGYIPGGTITLTPSHVSGIDRTLTASSGVFLKGDIGRQIINNASGETGKAVIIAVSSTTVVICDIIESFTDTNAIAAGDWAIDLSPVVELAFDGSTIGSIINVRPEFLSGTLGPAFVITGITAANPGVVTTSTAHGYAVGDSVVIEDVIGMSTLNSKIFTVGAITTYTFELHGENTSGYTAYGSGGIVRKRFAGLSCDAFRAADVGKYIKASGGVLEILTVNSATSVDALVLKSLNATTNTASWSLETDTWTSARGYPRAIGLFNQRLVYGGTATQNQTIWMSEAGLYTSFGTGPDSEDSIEVDLDSNEVNQINWMAESRDLIIGTSGGEFTLTPSASSVIPTIYPRTYYGSKKQQVATIGEEIIFVQGAGTKVRTFKYDFNIDSYTGEDLTFLSEHIAVDGIKEIAYAQEPYSIIYAITNTGELLSGTYDRSKRVIGWTKHITDGYYESVQTITRGSEDQVWVVVRRTINGSTKRYVEVFLTGSGEDDIDGFSDSYLTLSTPKTVSGITTANPAVVTATSHGFSNGNHVIIKGLVDPYELSLDPEKDLMSSLNDTSYEISNVTTHTFRLVGLNTSAFNSYGSGGEVFKKVSSISGLGHLEGKIVQVKTDGAAHPDETVSSGAITLDWSAGEVTVGLPYKTTLVTKSIEFDTGLGSMQAQRVRWSNPILRVYKSVKPIINTTFIPARSAADPLGVKIPLFTGSVDYGPLTWSDTSRITITLEDPLPLTLISITGAVDSGVI
jgi:hypothetical protein